MSGWLLDTNVLSELRRPRPNAEVLGFFNHCSRDRLFSSVASIAEVRYGIDRQEDGAKREALENWLSSKVRPMFEGRILCLTEDVLLYWRRAASLLSEARKRSAEPDLLIAATAAHHDLTLVTRNAAMLQLDLGPSVNPWSKGTFRTLP